MVEKVMINTIKALSAVSTNEVIASAQDSVPNHSYQAVNTYSEETTKVVRDSENNSLQTDSSITMQDKNTHYSSCQHGDDYNSTIDEDDSQYEDEPEESTTGTQPSSGFVHNLQQHSTSGTSVDSSYVE